MKYALLFLVGLGASTAWAQEEAFPCETPNPNLYEIFKSESLGFLYVHDCYGIGLDGMATSFLAASGTPPPVIPAEVEGDPDDSYDYQVWTCKYSAGNLRDGDPATAWVEGKEGYGEGEVVVLPCTNPERPLEIWAGYGKSQALFEYNSRPKIIEIALLYTVEPVGAAQYGTGYSDLKVKARTVQTLEDLNGFQPLKVPEVEAEFWDNEEMRAAFLAIRIVSVYPGTKWKDTCISEVRHSETHD